MKNYHFSNLMFSDSLRPKCRLLAFRVKCQEIELEAIIDASPWWSRSARASCEKKGEERRGKKGPTVSQRKGDQLFIRMVKPKGYHRCSRAPDKGWVRLKPHNHTSVSTALWSCLSVCYTRQGYFTAALRSYWVVWQSTGYWGYKRGQWTNPCVSR